MTLDRFNRGNALLERIKRLKDAVDRLKCVEESMDESPTRMTGLKITSTGYCDGCVDSVLLDINHSELTMLINAFDVEIAKLEREFDIL